MLSNPVIAQYKGCSSRSAGSILSRPHLPESLLKAVTSEDAPAGSGRKDSHIYSRSESSSDGMADDQKFRDDLVALIPSLRSFARGLCGRRDMADDLAQDAMMRGWAARSSFTPGTNFRAWMFVILRNQFYSTIRKDKRMTSWDPEVAERVLVEAPAQQESIHVSDVAKALKLLPAEQREVLLLIGANGLSYEEAAEVVGCAVGTIKSRLARGRKALALLIEGPEGDALFDQE